MERLKLKIVEDTLIYELTWNYHDSIQNGDMGITTNPLENINSKLKSNIILAIWTTAL